MSSEEVLIIAGEKSGEEHAKSFIEDLMALKPNLSFFGVGGPYFDKLGFDLLFRIKDFAAMGFSDVLLKIFFYLKAFNKILSEVDQRKSKYAILIDFQTFNLNLALKLKKKGVKVFYYVAPQAWAWKARRAKKLERSVEHLFCILPFEEKWFRDKGVKKVSTIKHPLVGKLRIKEEKQEIQTLLFLPGSRDSEVKYLLPIYFEFISQYLVKSYQLILVKSDSVNQKYYEPYESYFDEIKDSSQIEEAFKVADFAIAASGTVTLDCALWEIPTIVCYKLSLLNDFIAGHIPYKGYVSLPNLILDQEIYPELLRENCHAHFINHHFKKMLDETEMIKRDLKKLNSLLSTQLDSPTSEIIQGMS